jgi:O-methyltransferase
MYIELLKRCLLDTVYDSRVMGGSNNVGQIATVFQTKNGTYWPLRAHTMIGEKRLTNIEDCFKEIINNKIPGDLIETGVWRGGACIFMAGLNKFYNENRKIYVADSFEGLPPPDPKYPADNGDKHHTVDCLAVGLEEVQSNFNRYGLLDENVVFVKGFFEHSLKNTDITQISLLRLDGDMYSSTIQVLDQLYDKVSIGGFIVIDDYALPGCKKAIDDFRENRNITTQLIQVDWTGHYWIKE